MRRFLTHYAAFFRHPDVPRLLAMALVMRMPVGMMSLAMLMHLRELSGSFAFAGGMVGTYLVAMAASAPVQGRLIDRYGPRGALLVTGASVTGLGQVGTFGPPEVPSSGHKTGDYGDVAIGPNGQVLISYQDPTGGEGPATVYEALDPDGLGPSPLGAGTQVLVSNVGELSQLHPGILAQ